MKLVKGAGTIDVLCGGEMHQIVIDRHGSFHFCNHNTADELAALAFGAEVIGCTRMYTHYKAYISGLHSTPTSGTSPEARDILERLRKKQTIRSFLNCKGNEDYLAVPLENARDQATLVIARQKMLRCRGLSAVRLRIAVADTHSGFNELMPSRITIRIRTDWVQTVYKRGIATVPHPTDPKQRQFVLEVLPRSASRSDLLTDWAQRRKQVYVKVLLVKERRFPQVRVGARKEYDYSIDERWVTPPRPRCTTDKKGSLR